MVISSDSSEHLDCNEDKREIGADKGTELLLASSFEAVAMATKLNVEPLRLNVQCLAGTNAVPGSFSFPPKQTLKMSSWPKTEARLRVGTPETSKAGRNASSLMESGASPNHARSKAGAWASSTKATKVMSVSFRCNLGSSAVKLSAASGSPSQTTVWTPSPPISAMRLMASSSTRCRSFRRSRDGSSSANAGGSGAPSSNRPEVMPRRYPMGRGSLAITFAESSVPSRRQLIWLGMKVCACCPEPFRASYPEITPLDEEEVEDVPPPCHHGTPLTALAQDKKKLSEVSAGMAARDAI
mmetsp:Transcript_11131/g.24858  ORF Transcript_11131/g.24858 Transcript_11131/m.24858 type:complete len:298 (+) Transcript_11131:1619-2512(+)